MNTTNSTNNTHQIETWAKIIADCKEAKASGKKSQIGLTPKAFLVTHTIIGMPVLKLHT